MQKMMRSMLKFVMLVAMGLLLSYLTFLCGVLFFSMIQMHLTGVVFLLLGILCGVILLLIKKPLIPRLKVREKVYMIAIIVVPMLFNVLVYYAFGLAHPDISFFSKEANIQLLFLCTAIHLLVSFAFMLFYELFHYWKHKKK